MITFHIQHRSMITLSKGQVPAYLVGSDFYNSLSSDDSEDFYIPEQNYKPTTTLSNIGDLSNLLHTISFWGVQKLPEDLVAFLVAIDSASIERSAANDVFLEFDSDLKLARLYTKMRTATTPRRRLEVAANGSRQEVLEYVICQGGHFSTSALKIIADGGFVRVLKQVAEIVGKSTSQPFKEVSLKRVAALGHLDCLRFLLESGLPKDKSICVAAAETGQLACVLLAHELGCPWDAKVTTAAATHAQLACLTGLHAAGCPLSVDGASDAAGNGHVDCLAFVLDHLPHASSSKHLCNAAAGNGQLHCLKLLHERGCGWESVCTKLAARHGHLACLRYACEQGCRVDTNAGDAAAEGAQVKCLEYLLTLENALTIVEPRALHYLIICYNTNPQHRMNPIMNTDAVGRCLRAMHSAGVVVDIPGFEASIQVDNDNYLSTLVLLGYELPANTVDLAVECGAEKCLRYACTQSTFALTTEHAVAAARLGLNSTLLVLHQNHCVMDASVCAAVSFLHTLQLLRETLLCPWDEETCICAASLPTADVLQYAHEHGCAWSERVCAAAVYSGTLECLVYAHEHGCPWDVTTTNTAARLGDLPALRYAAEQGCPTDITTLCAAVTHPSSRCLEYLHERGCPWDVSVATEAASSGHTNHLRYCVEHGCPVDVSTSRAAAARGYLGCLQYLHESGCPWDGTVSRAALRSEPCLLYCVENGCPMGKATMEQYNSKVAAGERRY